jgi:hypothetical protein
VDPGVRWEEELSTVRLAAAGGREGHDRGRGRERDMYCFFGPLAEVAGSTRETISPRWFADGTRGRRARRPSGPARYAATGRRPIGARWSAVSAAAGEADTAGAVRERL